MTLGRSASRRVAIVTGVSRGLGEAIAAALLSRDVHVVGIGRRSAPQLRGERFRFVGCDLERVASIDAVLEPEFAAIAERNPGWICLVNNAAVAAPIGVIGRAGAADIAASIATNLAAPAALASLFCRVFGPLRGERRIVNVSSGAAARPIAGIALYCAAKSGLEMLTSVLALEQGTDGIRAVALRPGIVDTDMQTTMREQPDEHVPSVGMFREFHSGGRLVAPDAAAARIVDKVILAPIEQGRIYSYSDL